MFFFSKNKRSQQNAKARFRENIRDDAEYG